MMPWKEFRVGSEMSKGIVTGLALEERGAGLVTVL